MCWYIRVCWYILDLVSTPGTGLDLCPPHAPFSQSYLHEKNFLPDNWANRSEFMEDNGYSLETFLHETLMASSHRCSSRREWVVMIAVRLCYFGTQPPCTCYCILYPIKYGQSPTLRMPRHLLHVPPHHPPFSRRTFDPEEADFFYVPVYVTCLMYPVLGWADFPYYYAPTGTFCEI